MCSSLKHRKAECPLRGGTTSRKGSPTEHGEGGKSYGGGKDGAKGSGKKDGFRGKAEKPRYKMVRLEAVKRLHRQLPEEMFRRDLWTKPWRNG